METTIEFKDDALTTIIEKSGLERTKGQQLLEMFTPFFNRMAEIERELNLLNKDNPSKEDAATAKKIGTMLMKEVRKPAERVKDEGKKEILVVGRLYDNLYGVINNTSKGLEIQAEQIYKFQELQDLKRREERKLVRVEQLTPYVPDVSFFDLLNMEDAAFASLLAQQKAGKEALEAAEKKAEEDRIAKEKADAEAREAQRLENEKLKAEAAEKEKALAEERAKVESERKAAEEKAVAEKKAVEEKAAKEREESEKILLAERKAAAEKLEKEMEGARKLAAELKAKEDAEAKAKKEAEEKAAAELKAKQAEAKKLAKAGDKEKIQHWLDLWINVEPPLFPVVKEEASEQILSEISLKFSSFKTWAKKQAESI